jgi:hypothetical protein
MHQHIVTSPDNRRPADAAPLISVAKPADTLPGASVTLDASATTGASAYQWTQVSAPAGAKLSGDTTAKATVTSPVGR